MNTAFRASALALSLVLPAAGTAVAQETTVEDLERKLDERDKVILELLERVETLERRLGVAPGAPSVGAADAPTEDEAAPATAAAEEEPGRIVVDEAEAERALERSLTQAGALLLPEGVLEIQPSVFYARQEDETSTFVGAGGGAVFAGQQERNSDSLTADLEARLGLPFDSQIEIGLPYRWRNVETVTNVGFAPVGAESDTGTGFGDVRVGLAKTILREGEWRPDLVGRVTWDTATGPKTDNGISLGGGFNELRGSLTAIKRQDPIAFVGGLSYEHVFEDDDIQPGATIAGNIGGFIALSPETSLRLVLSAAYQEETEVFGDSIDGSDQTIGTFVIGGSTLLGRGLLLDLSAGIGLTDDADDFSVNLSLPIRFDTPIY